MAPELSDTMRAAIHFAKEYGGELTRHPGGFWQGPHFSRWGRSFGTPTIAGLVRRGRAEYVEWKESAGGRFPIKVRMIAGNF